MKHCFTYLLLVGALLCGFNSFAQTADQAKALEKGNKAVQLMDQGKFDESIALLEEAIKLDPGNVNYPYEIGYACYAKKDYKKAAKYLESILDHKDVNDLVFQLLGNTYDNMGNSKKAIDTYEAGLKLFPNSGNLYLEMGIVQMGKQAYNEALSYYEKGIEVDPTFASNYYWAARIYCSSTEEVWGMIYGEIFMNLERNTRRTAEISKLLYDVYASQIKYSGDTSISVSFSQNATINITDLTDPNTFKLPFGIGAYEPTLMVAIVGTTGISMASLDDIRTRFVETYFANGNSAKYPNVLFDYQKEILDAGHMEAYNHWVLMKGNESEFDTWYSANKDKFDSFVSWFNINGMVITEEHRFYSGQY